MGFNMHFLFILLILSIVIKLSLSTSCKKNDKISNKDCFNNILIFNQTTFRAGHSAQNQRGDFILQFSKDSEEGNRLFYGLNKYGRNFFPNENPTKEIILTGKSNIIARYESMNAFIALKNDTNKFKEYFLSISTYSCFMEIYDFTKEKVEFDTIYNSNYLGNQIFSFKFELLETLYENKVIYYLIFCHSEGNNGYGDKISVKKITFSDLNFNSIDITKTTTMSGKLNDRSVSGFLVDDIDNENFKILVAIYLIEDTSLTEEPKVRYKFNVYSLSDLSTKCSKKLLYEDKLYNNGIGEHGGYGLFFKVIYLGNQDVAMTYFLSNYGKQNPRFQVLKISQKDDCFGFDMKIYFEITESLNSDLVLNDFIKLTNTRLVFISSKGESQLCILLMDLYSNNYNI